VQDDPHPVVDVDPDLRPGHGAVVGPGVDRGTGLDLPGRDLGGQLELLDAAGANGRFEDLVAHAFGLGRVLGDGVVHGLGHLLVVVGAHLMPGMSAAAGGGFRHSGGR
jgi:hypothetical protein